MEKNYFKKCLEINKQKRTEFKIRRNCEKTIFINIDN